MTRVQLYLPDDMFADLKRFAKIKGKSMSEIMRQGINQVIEKKEVKSDPFKEFVGAGKTKIKTNAVKDIADYYENNVV